MHWILFVAVALVLLLAAVALFFFGFTKGGLMLRRRRHADQGRSAHIYPLYAEMWLIRLVDFQPVISAILLFQYSRLVTCIADALRSMPLQGQDALVTSCAFGNVMPRVVAASLAAGARKVLIVDLIQNELLHAERKLQPYKAQVEFAQGDATAMALPSASVTANVMFFLLHELDADMKRRALDEAVRVLKPGGSLLLAEFHKPAPRAMRALSWLYFKTFEPWGLALWDVQDPMIQLSAIDGMQCRRHTVLFGNFQVIVATKQAAG